MEFCQAVALDLMTLDHLRAAQFQRRTQTLVAVFKLLLVIPQIVRDQSGDLLTLVIDGRQGIRIFESGRNILRLNARPA